MDDSTAIQGRKHPWIAPAHATSLRLLILAVDANARTVDKCHGGRDSDYAVARVHRAHELCRQQAQASGGGYAPGRRRRAVKSERVYHCVPEVRIAALSRLKLAVVWSGDVLVTLSGSHVVIRESGRPRRGIATWTSKRFWLSSGR